jgi:hypothetical protein
MSTGTLRATTNTHKQIKTFIITKFLTAQNLSTAKCNMKETDVFKHFARLANTAEMEFYYQMFKKQYLTDKRFKSKLYLDAKYIAYNILSYAPEEFDELLDNRDGDKLKNCFIISVIANLNALRHDGVLQNMVNRYYKNIFDIAINKLKRNRIVNNGFLLKCSIRDCGMF